jgi:flagellar biosynthesis protein FlhB
VSDKTEEPTPRRLKKARESGDSPASLALAQSAALVAAILLLPGAVGAASQRFGELVNQALSGGARPNAAALAFDVVALSAPLLVGVAAVSALLMFVQTGGVVSAARLTPRLDRLDPVEGLRALFRPDRLFLLLRALATAAATGSIAFVVLRDHAGDVAQSTGNAAAIVPLVSSLAKQLTLGAAVVAIAFGIVDLVVTARAFRTRLRMSKDEVKREYREAEGDPEVKAKRRRAHLEALAGSMLNAVKEATVVIVNPTHLASALRYVDGEDSAPKVVALGQGELARRIVEAAQAYGVPCVRDVPVARALSELEIGDEIPEALYEAVAEILREVLEPREPSV